MHDIGETLSSAAAPGLAVPLDSVAVETLCLSDGISVALQQYRSPGEVTSHIEG